MFFGVPKGPLCGSKRTNGEFGFQDPENSQNAFKTREKPTRPQLDSAHRLASIPQNMIIIRDDPNTTTTIIFHKSFASDATSKRHLMTHQMKNLCGFSVFHCVEGAFGASSGGTPKRKMGPREMNPKMVVVVVGSHPI